MNYLKNFYGQLIPYQIGEVYIYPDDREEFVLLSVNVKNQRFHFNKDQWCTDLVFTDLIYKKTGRKVIEDTTTQLKLNL